MLGEPTRDRRAERHEATRAEILEAAWDMVRAEGLAALSLRDIARRVGMQAPSLYSYFESKHAIYDAMFAQGARAALETMTTDIATDDPRAALREGAHRFFEFATSDPARAQLLFQRTIPGFVPSAEAYAPAIETLQLTQARLAAAGITDPEATDLWTALVSGLISQQLANDPGGTRWARLIDRTVDMYLADVASQPPAPTKGNK